MRLNKYLAECGVCSRREADRIIQSGAVLVNGQKAVLGTNVSDTDKVMLHNKPIERKNEKIVLAYNKPVGVTCTEKDKNAKKNIIEALDYPIRVTYAGRLDKDSEGLMIMTNDGDLIENMMRGANCHEKEYIVKVNKPITDDFMQKMQQGIFLKELKQTTRPCLFEKIGKFTFSLTLTQGLNRQIRRMCESCGYQVISLKRIRVMNIELGNLKVGAYRQIVGQELEQLYEATGKGK